MISDRFSSLQRAGRTSQQIAEHLRDVGYGIGDVRAEFADRHYIVGILAGTLLVSPAPMPENDQLGFASSVPVDAMSRVEW